MPELPEVETVCRGLAKVLPGQAIAAVAQHRKDLRIPFPAHLQKIAGKKVTGISRRAKYILLQLSNRETMIIHLGMSGSLVLRGKSEKYTQGKHDHMVLTLKNGTRVVFNDPRRFGLVDLAPTKTLAQHRFFKHLGPEPFDKGFTSAYLAQKFRGKKVAIKLAIMDQRVVVGVGNIYASEALYKAGLDPRRAASSLTTAEIKKLLKAIQSVLKAAIKAGGSSLRDYVQTDGELGYFQHHWAVYDKAGKPCPGCKNCQIEKITQGGRSTFYCPKRQV